MSVDESTFRQLLDMGIDAPLARAAAQRFSSADAAVNWCFGDGANWNPGQEVLPSYQTTVSQHNNEPSPDPSFTDEPRDPKNNDSLRPPPPSQPRGPQLGSNNPFAPSSNSSSPSPAPTVADDDDEELRRALAMSTEVVDQSQQQGTSENAVTGEESKRAERERSVRASGVPPPSPEGEEGMAIQQLFAPSNKDDKEGKMAMVPAKPATNQDNEDDDFNRAVADSLMTASFHSASAQRDSERPMPGTRTDGAPLVLYSESGRSTYAANLLQGLLAIPQLREAIAASVIDEMEDSQTYIKITTLQEICMRMKSETQSFIEMDQTLRELRDGHEPNQLPPSNPAIIMHGAIINMMTSMFKASKPNNDNIVQTSADYWKDPAVLFSSYIDSDPVQDTTHVYFRRDGGLPLELYGALASIIWNTERPGQTIKSLSDILTVKLDWGYAAPRELWKLEERVVLDRFLTENARHTMQIRAQQAVAQGNIKRIKDRLDALTTHKEQNVNDSITTIIRHLETTASKDALHSQSKEEMKNKLKHVLSILESKSADIKEELKQEQEKASATVFETDDPALNRHAYILRAVLMHDGALVAGQHLWAYIRQDDGTWWRIQEHEVNPTTWEDIANDRSGLYMDGGPYLLLYSREASRPSPVPSIASSLIEPVEPEEEKDLMSFEEVEMPEKVEEGKEAGLVIANPDEEKTDHIEDSADGDVKMDSVTQ